MRIRVIHLFEANNNIFLKVLWADHVVTQGEKQPMRRIAAGILEIPESKWRSLNEAKKLQSQPNPLNKPRNNNDAKACYGRIVNGLAMLATCCWGMPTQAVTTHAEVLEEICHQDQLRTIASLHTKYIPSNAFWYWSGKRRLGLTLLIGLLALLQILMSKGMSFSTPSGSVMINRLLDAFVDDMLNGINDEARLTRTWSLEDLSTWLEDMS